MLFQKRKSKIREVRSLLTCYDDSVTIHGRLSLPLKALLLDIGLLLIQAPNGMIEHMFAGFSSTSGKEM